jgi:2-polyprenyl-3-methyl-5-hydroxy-6-metoxy-1,4-benzoquinol methylase
MLTVDFDRIPLRPGMHVLDAGCGGGRHICEAFRRGGVHVAGIDLGWEDLCRTKGYLALMAPEARGRWVVSRADVTGLPFADAVFDVVVCSEVLEHVAEGRTAVAELVRVLKPGGDLVVTVPRFLPERICWAISAAYHREPGGHIRIFKKKELLGLLSEAGAACWQIRYRHALHAPYWWLKCLVGHKNETFWMVRAYRKFLEWEIIRHPPWVAAIDRLLNPLIGKSMIFYLKKGYR